MKTIFDQTISLVINSGKIVDEIKKEINIGFFLRKIAYNRSEIPEMYKLKEKLGKYNIDIETLKTKYRIEPKIIGEGGPVLIVNGDDSINPNIVEF